MPKSERLKLGKRQNQNFWWFGFWHFQFLAARALMNMPNLSEIQTKRFCRKTECFVWFLDIFGLIVWNLNDLVWILASVWNPKNLVPFVLMDIPFSDRNYCLKSEQNRSDFRSCLNTKPSENGSEVKLLDIHSTLNRGHDYTKLPTPSTKVDTYVRCLKSRRIKSGQMIVWISEKIT